VDSFFWQLYTKTKYIGQRQATCQDCGYVWEYLMQEDIDSSAGKALLKTILFGALCAFSAYIGYFLIYLDK